MKELHFSVHPTQATKKQALEVIKQLKETIPIERAQMSLRIVLPKKGAKGVKTQIEPMIASVDSEEWVAGDLELVCCHCNSLWGSCFVRNAKLTPGSTDQ